VRHLGQLLPSANISFTAAIEQLFQRQAINSCFTLLHKLMLLADRAGTKKGPLACHEPMLASMGMHTAVILYYRLYLNEHIQSSEYQHAMHKMSEFQQNQPKSTPP
jgi:hypothetical protein